MADEEHLDRLTDVAAWNTWRQEHPDERVDLHGAELPEADLRRADLRGANLRDANLRDANLRDADLTRASLRDVNLREANLIKALLRGANMHGAFLREASLREADLSWTNLGRAYLREADLTAANLSRANLSRATLVDTRLDRAILTSARVYGASVWDVVGVPADQTDLIITRSDEPEITVDDLKLAQFIHLLIDNANVRDAIDTITAKVVLILGAFSEARKPTLDLLRDKLRRLSLTPIVFDFDVPQSQSILTTVEILARMSRYVLIDLSDPRVSPAELMLLAPRLTKVPIKPLIVRGQPPIAILDELVKDYRWVLPPFTYDDDAHLITNLDEHVLEEADSAREGLMS